MAKKFIEFLEAAALIILTAVAVIGVMKYVDSKEEAKDETPIVDVEAEKEIIEVQVQTSGPGFVDGSNSIKLKYYDGITWEEFMELNVDLIASNNSFDEDGYLTNGTGHWYSDVDTTEKISGNDLVKLDWAGTYYVVCIYYGE